MSHTHEKWHRRKLVVHVVVTSAVIIAAAVWVTVFLPNMLAKDRSMARYPEHAAWKKRASTPCWGRPPTPRRSAAP